MSVDTCSQLKDFTDSVSCHRRLPAIERMMAKRENRCQLLTLPAIQASPRSLQGPVLRETDTIKTSRLQSYKHWPHQYPTTELMASNGWFYCLVNDQTICIYCDTVCHNWKPTDDPHEVHSRLAPDCLFVRSITSSPSTDSPKTISDLSLTARLDPRHATMCELSRREKSFDNPAWTQTSPSAEVLAYAGFFYPGTGNVVTCFYCGGCLHKWSENDNPKVEHARWFPSCLYAKHLCGNRLYTQIQVTKKQLVTEKNKFDNDTLVRLVNARLDLPVVQRLREKYALAVIKQCIEQQLKMNQDDFQSDGDLAMACFLQQKQIDAIQGDANRIITPSENQTETDSTEVSEQKIGDCFICLTEERQLACMPCGHLCACVACGYALRTCPVCREKIQAFVRICY